MDVVEEKTFQRLNEAERAMLKAECHLGNSFGAIGLLAALLFMIIFLCVGNPSVAVLGAVVLTLAGFLIRCIVNKDFNADLANDQKVVAVKSLDRLEMNPLLNGENVSTAFNNRLSNFHEGYAAFSGGSMYCIDKKTFDQLQGQVVFELHYTPNSYTVLGVYPVGTQGK